MTFDIHRPCPCGSRKSYEHCCKVYHDGHPAENALFLMRSRYTAYALHLYDYIMKTTHPDNSDFVADPSVWTAKILFFTQSTRFESLEILDFQEDQDTAFVTFIAHLRQNGKKIYFKERSRFEKCNGSWLYREALLAD